MKTKTTIYDQLTQAEMNQLDEVKALLEEGGYSTFRLLLDGIQSRMKSYDEQETEEAQQLIAKARCLVPDPGQYSLSWKYVWDELETIIRYKTIAFETVKVTEREGDWQVILDNPYTNQQVACYPSLSFLEGAYLYAYFHLDLKPNEYVKLQKIVTALIDFGPESN